MSLYLVILFYDGLAKSEGEIIALTDEQKTYAEEDLKIAHIFFIFQDSNKNAEKTILQDYDENIFCCKSCKVESEIIVDNLPDDFMELKSPKHYLDTGTKLLMLSDDKSLELVISFYNDMLRN